MKNTKKYVLSILLFIILLVGTYYFVLRDYSVNDFINSLNNCNITFVLISFFGVFFYALFSAIYMKKMFKLFNKKISWYHAFGYQFTEVYFSAITPSSIGGQPVQMIEMKKDGISYQMNSVVVLLHTIIYKSGLIFLATFSILFFYNDLFAQNKIFIILFSLGYITTIILILFMTSLVYSKKLIPKIINTLVNVGIKLHIIKNEEKLKTRINKALIGYQDCAEFTKKNPLILLESFIILLLKRISLVSISYFIYLAFGGNSLSYFEIIAFQLCVTLACDFVPTPGGVAVSEGLLLKINQFIYGAQNSTSAMILFRGISFYIFVLFCGLYYLMFHYVKRKKAIDLN